MRNRQYGSVELIRALELAIKKKYPGSNYWRDQIALELALSRLNSQPLDEVSRLALTYQSLEEDATQLSNLMPIWEWVDTILELADYAITRNPDDGQKMKRWTPQLPVSLRGDYEQDQSAYLDRLTECASTYLKGHWAESPTLERWLVQQLIYAEAKAFARESDVLKKSRGIGFFWTWIKAIGTWVVGGLVAVNIGELHGGGLGFLSFLICLAVIHYLSQSVFDRDSLALKMFLTMEAAYKSAYRTNACPKEVERALSVGESNHVLWPEGLRGLVEHAVSRNSAIWQ